MKNKKTLAGRITIGLILSLFAIVTTSSFADDFNGAGVPQAGPSLVICEEGTAASGIESLGDKVLLYCGNGGNCSEGLVDITNLYVSMGVTVDTLFAFPADLSVYKLIFLVMPHVAFSATETSALDTFVLGGGRLVLLSDWFTFYTGQAVLNTLLTNLGVPIQVDQSGGVDIGCEQFTANIVADQITEGIASFEYGYTDTLTVSSPAKVLVKTKDGTEVTVAVGQPPGAPARPGADVVVAGDSNSFTDLCNPAVNEDFWWNLYNFEVLDVLVDIKPGSCPNPLNPKSKGSVPVAIVGTEDFDPVAMVDPSSVTLAGVSMNGIVEIVDSTQPHESDPNAKECYDCFDAEPDFEGDGYMDLVVKFDTQALAAAIADMGGAEANGCIDLVLEGETVSGVPIIGGDAMLVRKGIDASPAPPASGAHNLTTTWGNIKSR